MFLHTLSVMEHVNPPHPPAPGENIHNDSIEPEARKREGHVGRGLIYANVVLWFYARRVLAPFVPRSLICPTAPTLRYSCDGTRPPPWSAPFRSIHRMLSNRCCTRLRITSDTKNGGGRMSDQMNLRTPRNNHPPPTVCCWRFGGRSTSACSSQLRSDDLPLL